MRNVGYNLDINVIGGGQMENTLRDMNR